MDLQRASMTEYHLPQNWSYHLVDSRCQVPDSNLRFRKSRSGPEEDLIASFLAKLTSKSEPGIQLTIFKEPWLKTGSPDLVGVIWDVPTAEHWNAARLKLKPVDFRIHHQLTHLEQTDCTLTRHLFERSAWSSLDRLEAADMISIHHDAISVSPLDKVYAVRHIFAIEAKIAAWRKALDQAFLNRWFATSSHVLLPRMPSNTNAIATARSLGVSLWAPEVSKLTLRLPSIASAPTSYVSWLFNDWTWKVWLRTSSTYANSNLSGLDN